MIRGLVQYILLVTLFMYSIALFAQKEELKKGYYPDGSLRYEGTFLNGQPVGKIVFYFSGGGVQSEMDHNGKEVKAILYSKDGEYTSSGIYMDKKRVGEWIYKKGDKLLFKEQYKENKLDGMSVKYYSSGQIAEQKNWKHGTPYGEWKLFYNNGQIRLEALFVDGKLNGRVKSYTYDGVLAVEGTYKEDLKEDVWHFYNADGTLKNEQKYIDGMAENWSEEMREENAQFDKWVKEGKKIADPADFREDPEMYMRITD